MPTYEYICTDCGRRLRADTGHNGRGHHNMSPLPRDREQTRKRRNRLYHEDVFRQEELLP